MAHRLHALNADFTMHYCTRTPSRTAFVKDLAEGSLAPHVKIHHDDGAKEQLFSIDTSMPAPGAGTHVYVCGPPGFMEYVTGGLKRNGWPDENVHLEYFSNDALQTSGDVFTVNLARTGRSFLIPADKTILQCSKRTGSRQCPAARRVRARV